MSRRAWLWVCGMLAGVAVVAYAVAALIDEPLRRQLEARMNAQLTGYTVRIGGLDLHPLNFALHLDHVVIVQQADPKPPVASIRPLSASVEWRALLHRRLVGDVDFYRPRVHLNLAHASREAADSEPLTARGWQGALQEIYPISTPSR